MGLLDRLTSKKTSRKRTMTQIRYDKILTKNQNEILQSSLALNEAQKQEIKALRSILISQEDLYQEFGIEPQINNNIPQHASFNTSDLLASVAKGLNPEKLPFGKPALDAFVSFLQANNTEIDALGSHYMKQMIPKKEIESQVLNK